MQHLLDASGAILGQVRCRFAVSLAIAVVLSVSAGSARPAYGEFACPNTAIPARPPTLPHYDLKVRVLRGLHEAQGSLSIKFTPEQTTDRVVLRLWANEPYLARQGARLTVANVMLNDARPPTTRPNPTTLVVPQSLPAGETVRVSMQWRLRLPSGRSDRLYGGSVARLGSFFPLLAWTPDQGWQTDRPSAIGWESWTSPAADFDVTVIAPPGLQVLASGEQIARRRWRAQAVRDFALAVGRFAVARGVALAPSHVRLIVGSDDRKSTTARRYIAWARAALETHARRFGGYPWGTLTLVAADTGPYAWEYPTLAFVSTTGSSPRRGVAHEIAHQWFYSLIGNNQWRDPWLDEALASWGDARFAGALSNVLASSIPEPVRHKLGEPMSFWDQFGFNIRIFIDGAYTQGVQALASLGKPDAVDCALRLYAAQNAYETARPADLLRSLEVLFPGAREKLEAYGARF